MICGSIVMFLHFGQSGLQNALMMQPPYIRREHNTLSHR
jgi:hypothetical protein